MTTTRIAEVVDALVVLIREATDLQVLDGPSLDEIMPEAVVVGLAEDGPGYTVDVTSEPGMARPRLREDFTVGCMLTLVSGDTDLAPVRTRAAAALGAIDDAVRDSHRTAVWEDAVVAGAMKWAPLQTPDGVAVVVFFTVRGACLL